MNFVPLPPDHVRKTTNALLELLQSDNVLIPGSGLGGAISGIQLLQAVAEGQLHICQAVKEPDENSEKDEEGPETG